MSPTQYHEILIGLDRALFVLHESEADLDQEDLKLRMQIAIIRAQVLKAESGHPFPFAAPPADPEITMVPWAKS